MAGVVVNSVASASLVVARVFRMRRIKNITTEMQIFVDEFVTRVAELYGR